MIINSFKFFKPTYASLSILLISIFSFGCSNRYKTEISDPIIFPIIPQDLKEINTPLYLSDFEKLPSKTKVKNSIPKGRYDPFLLPFVRANSLSLPSSLTFNGILSINGDLRALISSSNGSGSVQEGSIGGQDTFLIPNGWLVENINGDKEEITFSYKEQRVNIELKPN